MLHLGPGNLHRAHQALSTAAALDVLEHPSAERPGVDALRRGGPAAAIGEVLR